MRKHLLVNCPATLRDTLRKFAYPLRKPAASLWKFLGLGDSDDDPRRRCLRFDIALLPKRLHPPLERAAIESGLFLDFAVADGRAAQYPADRPLLMRLPEHQPAVEPDRRAHSFVVPRLEKDATQPGAEVFAPHFLNTARSTERAVLRSRPEHLRRPADVKSV